MVDGAGKCAFVSQRTRKQVELGSKEGTSHAAQDQKRRWENGKPGFLTLMPLRTLVHTIPGGRPFLVSLSSSMGQGRAKDSILAWPASKYRRVPFCFHRPSKRHPWTDTDRHTDTWLPHHTHRGHHTTVPAPAGPCTLHARLGWLGLICLPPPLS